MLSWIVASVLFSVSVGGFTCRPQDDPTTLMPQYLESGFSLSAAGFSLADPVKQGMYAVYGEEARA